MDMARTTIESTMMGAEEMRRTVSGAEAMASMVRGVKEVIVVKLRYSMATTFTSFFFCLAVLLSRAIAQRHICLLSNTGLVITLLSSTASRYCAC
jgi:hypothetical protein